MRDQWGLMSVTSNTFRSGSGIDTFTLLPVRPPYRLVCP
jgi:hypothetical protein